jgi:two-component system, cell cycle sensor histidine kinase and response regulator CckA
VPHLPPPLVLLVDDDAEERRLWAQQLNAAGLEVVSAESAAIGFGLIGPERALDLMLLALSSPAAAELELAVVMARDATTRATPVVLLADRSDQEARRRALSLGADELLARAIEPRELVLQARVWARLGARQHALRLREQQARALLSEAESKLAEAERQAQQVQKLESMGRLAGGVAHDFNNMLTSIICFTRFVVDDMASEDPRRADLVEVLKAADSAARMISQLLMFSRRKPVQPVSLDVNAALASVGRVLRRTLGAGIELVILPAEEPLFVLFDPGQFDQLIFNFAVNAKDAMPAGGTITFKLARSPGAPDPPLLAASAESIELTIADSGTSMNAELAARAFEPSITVKGERGTGLGLAICQGIVHQAHGSIVLESLPGGGSCFRVLLPRAPDTRRADPSRGARGQLPVMLRGTALVVEDQPAILRTMTRALSMTGLSVLEAISGEAAIAVLDARAALPELLVTDIMLPRMSGQQLVEQLRLRNPELKVLYVSGYVGDELQQPILIDANTAFVAKPFTGQQLVTRAAALLAERDTPE